MANAKGKSRGNVKLAPPGYYTAQEAAQRLGLNRNTFRYYVKHGKIKRFVPPLRTEGYYDKKEIDQLANETALFFHTTLEEDATQKTETRVAQPGDARGIYEVLNSMGWQTAPIKLRLSWYDTNPLIDYVVLSQEQVAGYITAVPYQPDALEAIMSGRKRAWHMTAGDILPYEQGKIYNLYVGAAVRQEIRSHTTLAFRLLAGFIRFLEELATQGIIIHRMFAVSAEPDGQRLCKALGFVEQPAQEGDMFPRFVLDLETSESQFAQRYREALK